MNRRRTASLLAGSLLAVATALIAVSGTALAGFVPQAAFIVNPDKVHTAAPTSHAPTAAPTEVIHQDLPIPWNDHDYQSEDCDVVPGTGQVSWHFVLTSAAGSPRPAMLTASFQTAGTLPAVAAFKESGGMIHWYVLTGRDTLTGAWSNVSGGNLNLSHLCVGPTPTATPRITATPVITATPYESVGGATATPVITAAPCTASLFGYDKSGAQAYPMLVVHVWAIGTLPEGCSWSFSLNSYTTEGPSWSTSGTQSLYDHVSVTIDATHPSGTLTVNQPLCYGQTDFYSGTTRFDGVDGSLPHYPDSVVPQPLIAYSNGGGACATATPVITATPEITATPVITATPEITATPYESVGGETATPVITATPYESVGGETGTPGTTTPPTSTSGDKGSTSAPLMAMLICLAFGAMGLMAVEMQRRSAHR
jgi:hypothetical protein